MHSSQSFDFQDAHILKQLLMLLGVQWQSVKSDKQHVVVQPGQAIGASAPLGADADKQLNRRLVVWPDGNGWSGKVFSGKAKGFKLMGIRLGGVQSLRHCF